MKSSGHAPEVEISAFGSGNYACVCDKYVYRAQSINTKCGRSRLKSFWFRAVYPALPGGMQGMDLNTDPISNHATGRAHHARARVYVNISTCMLLLWYSSVQRMQLGITVMLNFHLIKSTLFVSMCINSK